MISFLFALISFDFETFHGYSSFYKFGYSNLFQMGYCKYEKHGTVFYLLLLLPCYLKHTDLPMKL